MLLNRVAGVGASARIDGLGFSALRQPVPGRYSLGRTARRSTVPAERADRLEISPTGRSMYQLFSAALGLQQRERPGREFATLASTALARRYDRRGRAAVRVTPPAVIPVAPAQGGTGAVPDVALAPAPASAPPPAPVSAPAPALAPAPDLGAIATAIAAYDRQRRTLAERTLANWVSEVV